MKLFTHSCKILKMRDLEKTAKMFYSITCSSKEEAKKRHREYYFEHTPNEIAIDTSDRGIRFYPKEYIILQTTRGDQLTEIITDSQCEKFLEVSNEKIMLFKDNFYRYYARKVLVGESFSLSKPETIKQIIEMSNPKCLEMMILMDGADDFLSLSAHLKSLGFSQSYEYWKKYVESRLKE